MINGARKTEVHEQTLINKRSKIVYVGQTSITKCQKETPKLPAITPKLSAKTNKHKPYVFHFSYVPGIHL